MNEETRSLSRFGEFVKRRFEILNTESKSINTLKRNKWTNKILEERMKVQRIEIDRPLQTINNEEHFQITACLFTRQDEVTGKGNKKLH